MSYRIDISQKDSQEQAGCLFHNNYARCLMNRRAYAETFGLTTGDRVRLAEYNRKFD